LQRAGTFDGPNDRGEFDQRAIASCLDDPPAMLGNEWIGCNPVLAQRPRRTRFVPAHQSRIPRHVGG
jgi:hypothetical protein